MKTNKISITKSIKLIMLLLFFFFSFSCEEKENIVIPPTCESDSIDFSFADSIAGTYYGSLKLYNPSSFIANVDTFIYVNVYDYRTATTCVFYIDYFDKYVYVLPNYNFFAETWEFYGQEWFGSKQYLYLREASFRNNKLKVSEEFSTKLGGFWPRILNAQKI